MPIPSVLWPAAPPGGGVVPARGDINDAAGASAAEARTATVLASGLRIPLIYGRTAIGARADIWAVRGGYLYMRCIVGHGPIDAVESVLHEGAALPAGVDYVAYLGAPGQGVDPWLAAVFAAQTPADPYVDTLPGIAYIVLRVPVGALAGLPALRIVVRGRLLYDPRTGLVAYSDNPALAFADLLASTAYGADLEMDWDSVAAVADRADQLVGPVGAQEKRRTLGLAIVARASVPSLIAAMRLYAGCWVDRSGPLVRLVADAPADPVMRFDRSNTRPGSMRRKRGSVLDLVTEGRLTYTEPAAGWQDEVALWQADGVAAGTVEAQPTALSAPGITRASQAVRELIERANKLRLCDFEARWIAFDVALRVRRYDVVELELEDGTIKPMRVMDIRPLSPGVWELHGAEYDPAVWSDAVATAPSYPDSALPSPLALPAVGQPAVAEEFFTTAEGFTASRLSVTWPEAGHALVSEYRVELWAGETLLAADTAQQAAWRSGSVVRGTAYGVRVQALSGWSAGAWSPWALHTALGKGMRPTDVERAWGFEAGGEVRLQCTPAIDIDERRYEWRWGAVGCAWGEARIIDRVDGLRLNVNTIPEGTWDFLVKALDSVRTEAEPHGQYSLTAARCTIEVTRDAAAYLVDEHDFSAPTVVSGMRESRPRRSDTARRYVTVGTQPAAEVFAGALSGYAGIAATWHAPVTSVLQSEVVDFGALVAGNWHGQTSAVALSGAVTELLLLSPDAVDYAEHGLDVKAAGRFARLRLRADGASTLLATVPELSLRVDATPRTHWIEGTTLASGGLLVIMPVAVAKYLSFPITAVGSAGAVTFMADELITGSGASFRLYAFDSATQDQVAIAYKGEVRYA